MSMKRRSELKSFSSVKSLKESLLILGIKDYIYPIEYEYKNLFESEVVKSFIDSTVQDIYETLKVINIEHSANEADREEVAHFIVLTCVKFLVRVYKVDISIGSKKSILGSNSRGILDFCVYKTVFENSEFLIRILTVFEVKQELMDKGSGQLLLELKAVYEKTRQEVYGAVTNLRIWEFFSYTESSSKCIVKRFKPIFFEDIKRPSEKALEQLIRIILDSTTRHEEIN